MEFSRFKEDIPLIKRTYVLYFPNETGMKGYKAANTPIESNLKLWPIKTEEVRDKEQYQRLVEAHLFISHETRYSFCC